jgi:UTP--glucose-1-phosphate uridylyltransferase
MIRLYERRGNPVIALQEVAPAETRHYGIVAGTPVAERVVSIADMIEKPKPEEAPSNLAIIGRYVLTPDIFPALEQTAREKDRTGEIQLTNGLRKLLKQRPIYGCRIDGVRHDTGNKLGFLKAVVYFALKRDDLSEPFRAYLRSLGLDVPAGSRP